MRDTYIRRRFDPPLERPSLIIGLPGPGNIGRIAVKLLIEKLEAKIFAELYSPTFPDHVLISRRGVCRLPRYEFYIAKDRSDIVILTGDGEPSVEDVTAHYELGNDVIDFAARLRSRRIIVVDGLQALQPTGDILVASTSKKMYAELTGMGAAQFRSGSIVGVQGLILGLAKMRRMEGTGILISTEGLKSDRIGAFRAYEFLVRMLEKERA
ncbi:MAG: PAC2 family protein [Nitrososphaerota archaeon]|nr:PAC2 family protein [Candidatus Bathyarchaeota archaeon]MDW8049109.1 PAC2 family protein [Nitrososphaerota archaeon]